MESKKPETTPIADTADKLVRQVDKMKGFATTVDKKMKMMTGGVYVILVVLGILTGYVLSQKMLLTSGGFVQKAGYIQTDKVIGTTDTKTFKDSAIGIIEKDGTDGEGTHQLTRDGGPSQTVVLISSVIDLDKYVGKKVKVYGETFAAKKAAWLMDVGKIELQ